MKVKFAAASMIAAVGLAGIQPADAAVVLTMLEVGSDVVVAGGGTADLDGFATLELSVGTVIMDPSLATLTVGTPGPVDVYGFGVSGPSSFGPGFHSFPTTTSGDFVGVVFGRIAFRAGYVSGAALTTTMTFSGATFASLGVTPGTYVYSWGSGPDLDTLTLLIGPDAVAAARVPAPASALLLGLGVVAAAVARSRRSA